MKKTFPLLLLGLFFCLGFSFSDLVDPIYENVRGQAVDSFRNMFAGDIKIGSAGGRILGKIVLKDVGIGPDLKAQEVVLRFNVLKYLAKKMDIVAALDVIEIKGGEARITRNARGELNALQFLKPPQAGAPAGPPFKAVIKLKNSQVTYVDEAGLPYKKRKLSTRIEKINGQVNLKRFPRITLDLTGTDVKIKGSADLGKNRYDIKLSADKLPIKSWGNYIIPLMDFSSGSVQVNLKVTEKVLEARAVGTADKINFETETSVSFPEIEVTSAIRIRSGEYYGQRFSGFADLTFKRNQLMINQSQVQAYGGELSAKGLVDLKKSSFDVTGDFKGLDLKYLKTPGVYGWGAGAINLSGTFNDFSGSLDSQFVGARAIGQDLTGARARINYKAGELTLNEFRIFSPQAEFAGTGIIGRDRQVALSGKAVGLALAGEGFLGPMSAKVRNFDGTLDFVLDDAFFKNPLKNLNAEGSFEVVEGRLGEQEIDHSVGHLIIGSGRITIEDTFVRKGASKLTLNGEVGIGSNYLTLAGERLDLKDLKILNSILPSDLHDLTGSADLKVEIKGEIPETADLASLMNLKARVELKLRDGEISRIKVREVSLTADYEDRSLKIKNAYFKTNNSLLAFDLELNRDDTVRLSARGQADLMEFKPLLLGTAQLGGVGKVDIDIHGKRAAPDGKISFKIKNFFLNEAVFDDISGALELRSGTLTFTDPMVFDSKANRLIISGSIGFKEKLEESPINLMIELPRGSLADIVKMIESINSQAQRFIQPGPSRLINIQTPRVRFPELPPDLIFFKNGKPSPFLVRFERILKQLSDHRKSLAPPALEKISGQISGKIRFTGKLGQFTSQLKLGIRGGTYGRYHYDSFDINATLADDQLTVKEFLLRKRNGWLSVRGQADLKAQTLDLAVEAHQYPIDVLKLVLDRAFEGEFDLKGQIYGPLNRPLAQAELKAQEPNLAGARFKELTAQATWEGDTLSLNKLEISDDQGRSSASGYYSLKGEGQMTARINGNFPGLINLFTDQVSWKSGHSQGYLAVKLRRRRPEVSGSISIEGATVYVKALDADLQKLALNLTAKNGQVELSRLLAYWVGKSTQNKVNFASFHGAADLNKRQLQLVLSDTILNFDLPGMYKGQVGLRGVNLAGNFDGLKLAGAVDFSDGVIYLPETSPASGGKAAVSPLNLDLTINLKQNLYLTGGNVMTLNLSNIMFNLEMYGDDLKLFGGINSPNFLGKIFFKRGTINILTREFILLNAERQKQFYPYDLDRIQDNYAQFFGEGILPYLNLVGMVPVEQNVPLPEDPTKIIRKEICVVTNIKGTLGSVSTTKAVDLKFEAFALDNTRKYVPAGYTNDQIKVLLLPDFVKSITGVEGGAGKVESNAVVADYLGSRIQTVVFRGLERQIEQALGLNSLTLDYNFGSDIKKAMGVQDVTVDKPTFGVGFVKGFFDKLYIDVRYSKWGEGASTQSETLNYQITYKLTSVFSLVYFREPVSLQDVQSGPYKMNLNAGFKF